MPLAPLTVVSFVHQTEGECKVDDGGGSGGANGERRSQSVSAKINVRGN